MGGKRSLENHPGQKMPPHKGERWPFCSQGKARSCHMTPLTVKDQRCHLVLEGEEDPIGQC